MSLWESKAEVRLYSPQLEVIINTIIYFAVESFSIQILHIHV